MGFGPIRSGFESQHPRHCYKYNMDRPSAMINHGHGWSVDVFDTGVHVTPVDDTVKHEQDCWCIPLIELNKNSLPMYVHHSVDGRELDE